MRYTEKHEQTDVDEIHTQFQFSTSTGNLLCLGKA